MVGSSPDWEIRAELSDKEYKRALNRFWFYQNRTATWIRPLVLLVAVRGSFLDLPPIVIGLVWIAVGISFLSYASTYVRYRRRNMQVRREFEDRASVFRFSDDGVAVSSELGSAQLKWRAFDKLRKHDDMWLLVARKAQFFILPTRALPEELRQFIEHRVQLGAGRRPKCQACGYDLRGLKEPRCPECGAAFDPALLKIRQ